MTVASVENYVDLKKNIFQPFTQKDTVCKYGGFSFEQKKILQLSLKWWQLWNSKVRQEEFNRFLYSNEHCQYIQLYRLEMAPLLSKHYWNEVYLTGQNLA